MKIAVCTPAYANLVGTDYVRSLLGSLADVHAASHELLWLAHGNVAAVPRVRNRMVEEALRAEADVVMFIDSDLSFDGLDMVRIAELAHSFRAIVGAVMPTPDGDGGKKYPFRPLTDGLDVSAKSGLAEVEAIPTAFMAISAHVLQGMSRELPTVYTEGLGATSLWFDYGLLPGGPGGTDIHAGEDFWFCTTARRLGYQIFVDPHVELGHVKYQMLTGALAETLVPDGTP